jgi:DNA-binding transcriptional LysR family regulator
MIWDDLRVFLALERQRSHAGAARLLGVDPTTVGRRLAALEEAVGVRLFQRTRAGLVPTDEGTRLATCAARIEAEVLAVGSELRGGGLDGPVRITAGDGILASVLLPSLGELLARHPRLRVELCGASQNLDLSRREADVALRLSRPKEPYLVTRRIATVPFRLFASEAYLARHGRPTSEAALGKHELIAHDQALDHTPPMVWLRARARRPIRIRCTLTGTLAAACVAGLGIALAIPATMRGLPGVVEVLPRAKIPVRELWSMVHADMRNHPRVDVVLDWAAAAVAVAFR